MHNLVEKWKSKGWQVIVEENNFREPNARYSCELIETKQALMPHSYICAYGATPEEAIKKAEKKLKSPEPYPTVAERYQLPVDER